MKRRLVPWTLITLVACSCSPFYERELPDEESYLFIAKIDSTDLASADVVLLVRVKMLDRCNSGEIKAEPMEILSLQSGKFEQRETGVRSSLETLPCQSLRPLTPSDLRVILNERGYQPGSEVKAPPRSPLYSNRTRPPAKPPAAIIVYRTIIETVYLSYNARSIQIVNGSYGNRSGIEQEHTYSVFASDDRLYAKTDRLISMKVRYDRLPEWW